MVWLLAALLSLTLNLQLRRAGELGFYDSDYNQLQDARRPLARALLTDEPLFNLYHAARYRLLGENARLHHLLQGLWGLAAALLAFGLVRRLFQDALFALVFLLLFLTCPNRGEAVYWPGALYPLLLALLLGAAHCVLSGRWRAGWGLYTAAVFTHEAAFGFLAVMAALGWRERRRLAWFAGSNAAYLLARQTQWFGLGDPGYLYMRPLDAARIPENLAASLRVHFGANFWADTERLLREGSAGGSLLPWLAPFAAALVAAAGRRALPGAAAAIGVTVGLAWWTSAGRLPDLMEVLRIALVLAAAGAALAVRRVTRDDARPVALGVLWFFAAYAPAYVLYIAPRHGYLPSVGVCLILAAVLWWPQRQSVALGLAALIAAGFYAAGRGEVERWVRAAGVIRSFRVQMLAAHPALPRDTCVAVEGLPNVVEGVPALPDYALEAALRQWYGHDQILARRQFLPACREAGRLLAFTWDHGRLVPRDVLRSR